MSLTWLSYLTSTSVYTMVEVYIYLDMLSLFIKVPRYNWLLFLVQRFEPRSGFSTLLARGTSCTALRLVRLPLRVSLCTLAGSEQLVLITAMQQLKNHKFVHGSGTNT
jgi:hypothetical protein